MKRAIVIGLLAFASACVTAPETRKEDTTPVAETPEVPYAPKTVAAPEPTAAAGDTLKPATGGPAPAEATTAPPPAPVFDASTQARFKEGVAALAQGNANQAEAAFKDVLSRNDRAAYAWTNLGVIEERRGEFGAAERDYRKALDIDSGQDTAWDYLARMQCRQRKCAQVDSELRAALRRVARTSRAR